MPPTSTSARTSSRAGYESASPSAPRRCRPARRPPRLDRRHVLRRRADCRAWLLHARRSRRARGGRRRGARGEAQAQEDARRRVRVLSSFDPSRYRSKTHRRAAPMRRIASSLRRPRTPGSTASREARRSSSVAAIHRPPRSGSPSRTTQPGNAGCAPATRTSGTSRTCAATAHRSSFCTTTARAAVWSAFRANPIRWLRRATRSARLAGTAAPPRLRARPIGQGPFIDLLPRVRNAATEPDRGGIRFPRLAPQRGTLQRPHVGGQQAARQLRRRKPFGLCDPLQRHLDAKRELEIEPRRLFGVGGRRLAPIGPAPVMSIMQDV